MTTKRFYKMPGRPVVRSIFVVWLMMLQHSFSSCGIITKGSQLDVVSNDGMITSINMAPRHYQAKKHCEDILKSATANLLTSLNPLSPESRSRLPWYSRITNYRTSDCAVFKKRGAILKDFDRIYADHSNKIGILLPPIASNEEALQIILSEIRDTLVRFGVSDPDVLVIKRVEKTEAAAKAAAAELIHINRVTLLVGFNNVHNQAMVHLADPTQVPVLMVSPSGAHSKSKQSMRVYPPVNRLAKKLLDQYQSRNITNVSVLYPKGADLDLLEQLRVFNKTSISFVEFSYDTKSSENILATVKRTTNHLEQKTNAKNALLILDNFKMVRHIVNIARSSLMDHAALLSGNQQWRSPALVIPKEDALEGALFVDYIGDYRNLPAGITVPIPESPFFTTAQAASRIDYQIIGHRIGTLSSQAIKRNWSRQRIATELQLVRNQWDNYFPSNELTFDQDRNSAWPAYLFQVQGESIKITDDAVIGGAL